MDVEVFEVGLPRRVVGGARVVGDVVQAQGQPLAEDELARRRNHVCDVLAAVDLERLHMVVRGGDFPLLLARLDDLVFIGLVPDDIGNGQDQTQQPADAAPRYGPGNEQLVKLGDADFALVKHALGALGDAAEEVAPVIEVQDDGGAGACPARWARTPTCT